MKCDNLTKFLFLFKAVERNHREGTWKADRTDK